jgi:hypothetical protein
MLSLSLSDGREPKLEKTSRFRREPAQKDTENQPKILPMKTPELSLDLFGAPSLSHRRRLRTKAKMPVPLSLSLSLSHRPAKRKKFSTTEKPNQIIEI